MTAKQQIMYQGNRKTYYITRMTTFNSVTRSKLDYVFRETDLYKTNRCTATPNKVLRAINTLKHLAKSCFRDKVHQRKFS